LTYKFWEEWKIIQEICLVANADDQTAGNRLRNEKFAAICVSLELASFRSASEPGPWYRGTERRAAGRKPLIRVALSLSAASVGGTRWRDMYFVGA